MGKSFLVRFFKKELLPSSYAGALAWIAAMVAIAIMVTILVENLFVDFVHGNPHRTHGNAVVMMIFDAPLFGVMAMIGVLLVFGLSQGFQTIAAKALVNWFGYRTDFAILLALPMTAVITWYSFDYLTPSDFNLGINVDPDGTQYRHGLTAARYWAAVAAQAPVTLFTLAYARAAAGGLPRKALVGSMLAAAIFADMIFGHRMAETQYQFL